MDLILQREPSTASATPGTLSAGGKFIAFTLEDKVRALKIAGKTAIPPGTYDLRISRSVRFKKDLPEVLSVPEFLGVRIHGGTTASAALAAPVLWPWQPDLLHVAILGCIGFLQVATARQWHAGVPERFQSMRCAR